MNQRPILSNKLGSKIFREYHFVCSERHRVFFEQSIGKSFKFNVVFQKWLKANGGKTYKEAIAAYHQILEDKKKGKSTIDKQFEYNTYIRDFLQIIQANHLMRQLSAGNIKRYYKGIINMKKRT